MNGEDELLKYGNHRLFSLCCLLASEGTSAEDFVSLFGNLNSCSGNLYVQYGGYQGLCVGP